ncbi:DUF3862 domain-containing protein [Priestia aryabhattai]|uniref:DUF3862 domain-containing protein n=1 Tax=Priestia aryabhattai TaxID=412384 RepID=UPI002175194E|nr:DUF3862 domain-containing protein [Priestia aryabhattai]
MKKLMFAMAMCGMLAACSSTTEDTSSSEEPKKEEVKEEKAATPKTTEDTNETSEEANTTEATEEDKVEPTETPAEEPAKEESNDPGISKAEFDKIQNGMSYEEVVQIIGGEGELNSESGAKGDQYYTVMYTWNGESGFGANANAMFQGNPAKLQNKSQFGLE